MAEKHATEHIIKVLDVIIEAGNVAPAVAAASGAIGKVTALLPLTDELLALITLKPKMLVTQWQDLDEQERFELMEHCKQKYDIADDALETTVEYGLELVNEAVTFCTKLTRFVKAFRKG